MDENSCESSESPDGQKAKDKENSTQVEYVGLKLNLGRKKTEEEQPGFPLEASVSGPSTLLPPVFDNNGENTNPTTANVAEVESLRLIRQSERITSTETFLIDKGTEFGETSTAESMQLPKTSSESLFVDDGKVPETTTAELSEYEEGTQVQTRSVRSVPAVEMELASRKPNVGPPPSYSFVMKQKRKLKPVPSVDHLVIRNPPPPSYAGSRSMYLTPEERIYNFPSFAEPIWRSQSQPALCPRCGIIVITTTHTHDSLTTHLTAFTLCLLGCWPCCLFPYFLSVCKNTYHHCPICQAFLGRYRPW